MSRKVAYNPNAILPPGTQVVTRVALAFAETQDERPQGAVGEIVQSPIDHTHAYRVRFVDGDEIALRRTQFAVLKHLRRPPQWPTDDVLDEFDLMDRVVYRCVVGSRAYGLDHETSDVDRRGIYLPPAEMHWSLFGVPEQLESPETEECYWELQKFLTLALKANPNVLECLYTPLVEHAAPIAQELRRMRDAFLSKLLYQTYNGYVLSQFKKLHARIRNHNEIKWKHAMHLIRLLLAGIVALRDGVVPVAVEEHRAQLLAIRSGEMPWTEVDAWRRALHRQFDEAYAHTTLPDRPDYDRVNDYLVRARAVATKLRPIEGKASTARVEALRDSLATCCIEVHARFDALRSVIDAAEYPLLFATVSGAHLYGFPSADSDFDLRGVHVLPTRDLVGLYPPRKTIEHSEDRPDLELDLVTHDAAKFFRLLLKKNGYVLEQLYSPLILHTTPEHAELKAISRDLITRHHAQHYLGFARTQWSLFEKQRRVKPLLYLYRVLLTGIHLMRSGVIEANLVSLTRAYPLPYIEYLLRQKTQGREKGLATGADLEFHREEYRRLMQELETASAASALPDEPSSRDALHDLLVRLRNAR